MSLWFALLAAFSLAGPLPSARAAITSTGDVSPSDPSTWTSSTIGYIGNTASGTLTVDDQGHLLTSYGNIGNNSGASGIVTISGTGSTWTANRFYVGNSGSGTLSIANGGSVSSNSSGIGGQTGATGVVTVDGAGSTWTNSGDLSVGDSGSGTLSITNGAGVSVGGATYAGTHAGSTGAIDFGANGGTLTTKSLYASPSQLTGTGRINTHGLVSDIDLLFNSTDDLDRTIAVQQSGLNATVHLDMTGGSASVGALGVGCKGTASLTIQNGMTVQSEGGFLGYGSGSMGVATVAGAGSTWDNGMLVVGNYGSGMVSIINGGSSTGVGVYIGYYSGSAGTVTVDDANLTLILPTTSTIAVGYGGSGTLLITNGSSVGGSNQGINNGYIGAKSGSSGTVRVDGAGSKWTNNAYLYVGHSGSGTLSITNGGSVSDGYGFVSRGVVTVDGAGSKWTNNAYLYVGHNGSGTLSITNGGSVSNTDCSIGIGADEGTNTVVVDGAGSTWTNNGRLDVGGPLFGGTVLIVNGGSVSCRGSRIYSISGRKSEVRVDGAGSIWTNSGSFDIGSSGGSTTLSITNGGKVSNNLGVINGLLNYTLVTVDGAGSTWINEGSLTVTRGTLSITNGGNVGNTGGGMSGSVVTVDGTGSMWTNNGGLAIGGYSAATLSITRGGSVTASSVEVSRASLLAIDVGHDSLLRVGGGTGSITNNGTIRILAGAGVPGGTTTFSPISAGTWSGTGTYQAVGGTWNKVAHKFTASSVTPGVSGSAVTLDRAAVQRALITGSGTDGTTWTVGASFLAAGTTTNMTFTATAMDDAILDPLKSLLPTNESVLSGWTFATTDYTVSSTNPVYLSFKVGPGHPSADLDVWHFDGSVWTEYAATDLTYDGTYASFTVTGLSGYAMIAVPEPGTLALLAAGLVGLLAYARRKRGL